MHVDLRVKALMDGLDVNFEDTVEIDNFADLIKEIIVENPHYDCDVVGDSDGLLISDKNDIAILTIVFNPSLIKFHILHEISDFDQEQSEIIARVVLAVIGGLLSWYGDSYLETDPLDLMKITEEQRISQQDIPVQVVPGDTFKYQFTDDGFGIF